MCDCINKMVGKLKAKLATNDPVGDMRPKSGTLVSVDLPILGLNWATGQSVILLPFEAQWELPSGRRKTTKCGIVASHCPLCGEPLKEVK